MLATRATFDDEHGDGEKTGGSAIPNLASDSNRLRFDVVVCLDNFHDYPLMQGLRLGCTRLRIYEERRKLCICTSGGRGAI